MSEFKFSFLRRVIHFYGWLVLLIYLSGCTKTEPTLFVLKTSDQTGISFANNLQESEMLNYFSYSYMYLGGGVAIADFNNDGREDIYFTANQEANRLYINKGNLKFNDITESSGLMGDDRWYTGVSIVDINQDGWLDIYLSVAGKQAPHTNELYVNNGDLTFTESAVDYGIADVSHSYQSTFFDYDLDGDLDLIVSNYPQTHFGSPTLYYRRKMNENDHLNSDHLYENVDGLYVDVTDQSGLQNFGLTMSMSIADFNLDGWPDIYMSNDFSSPDYLFLNQGDKTFVDVSKESLAHTAMYGMGLDANDINNDGLVDLLQLDMSIQDNYRNKTNMASMDIGSFWNQVGFGLHHQYMQNTIQLNNGIMDGTPYFSDVSRLTGLSSTDWSWSILAMDVNNDTQKDVFVTNGIRKEINNKDFFNEVNPMLPFLSNKRKLLLSNKIPTQAIPNYLFLNKGDLTFEEISHQAGTDQTSFSNGMAYGDLDNDGDLDVVINNIDKQAFFYENTTNVEGTTHYLKVRLKGKKGNQQGIGAKIFVKTQGAYQIQEQQPSRGYLSSISPVLHFGLADAILVDTVKVMWPGGNISYRTNVKVDQLLEIAYGSESSAENLMKQEYQIAGKNKLFQSVNPDSIINYYHQENSFNDFGTQILLPHKMSQFGPALAVADFNGDDLDDLFLGGSVGFPSAIYFQTTGGFFEKREVGVEIHIESEDVDAIAFDADGDGDQDLYVVSGGNEYTPFDGRYKDRLYYNNGQGKFDYQSKALPNNTESGSVVKPYDFDEDGDLDLFVGGRHMPHHYPKPGSSFIYENREGQFVDVTSIKAPFLSKIGMVTDAKWGDFDLDGSVDLMIVGEWMSPILCRQEKGKFTRESKSALGLEKMEGWWFSAQSSDLDADGDLDIVLGNLGVNYKYQASRETPFKVFSNDFDQSGSTDIVLSYEQNGNYYPVRGRQCSSQQIPDIKVKFKNYNNFAQANVEQIYGDMGLNDATELSAYTFASTILINDGKGTFKSIELPRQTQVSSVNDILIDDLDGDGILDLILAGNLYTSEVETTRNDASYGMFLKGNGDGTFEANFPYQSGLFIQGDTKKLNFVVIQNERFVVAANNNGKLTFNKVN